MKYLILFFALVFTASPSIFAQEGQQLPPILVQRVERIGGNYTLRSPEILSASVGDQLARLNWPKYTHSPSGPYTGLYLNYNVVVIERVEHSYNGWSVNPGQLFRELQYFSAHYSQNASDTRARYICGIEVWCILDSGANGGRIEIARGRGGAAGAFEFLPYKGGSTHASARGGSYRSSYTSSMTNPLSLQEDALMKEAVGKMFADLGTNLGQRGFTFQAANQVAPPFSGQAIGGPPTDCNSGTRTFSITHTFAPGEYKTFRGCRTVSATLGNQRLAVTALKVYPDCMVVTLKEPVLQSQINLVRFWKK